MSEKKVRIFCVYDPVHGEPTADGLVADLVADIVNSSGEKLLYTSSSLVIDYLRLAVFNEKLSPSEIAIRFQDMEILIDKDGRFSQCPIGFCDYVENVLMQMI